MRFGSIVKDIIVAHLLTHSGQWNEELILFNFLPYDAIQIFWTPIGWVDRMDKLA